MQNKLDKIVISRTDSIGDVILTLPIAGILKQKYPDAKIIFFGNTYTQPIITSSVHVDEIWEWAEFVKKDQKTQLKWLKSQNIDAFIHIFPRKELARLVKKAGIKIRIGTSHRLYHITTCNYRPNFTRKNSELHEAQLNTKLLSPLGIGGNYSLAELNHFVGFENIPTLKDKFKALLDPTKINLILHSKSQGSAIEWGVENFIKLAIELDPEKVNIFFTGTEKESEYFRSLLPIQENIHDVSGQMDLFDLIAFIANADAIVAASTGPLHIGGILGIRTIGLFANLKPMHAGRWQPLGNDVVIMEDEKKSEKTQPLLINHRSIIKGVYATALKRNKPGTR